MVISACHHHRMQEPRRFRRWSNPEETAGASVNPISDSSIPLLILSPEALGGMRTFISDEIPPSTSGDDKRQELRS